MKKLELSKKGKKNKGKYRAIVDDDIFDIVNEYSWSYHSNGYVSNTKTRMLLHRFIWELKVGNIPDNKEIEHIDQNKLNCQISNLRLATHAENMRNIGKRKNNKSGYNGISKEIQKDKNRPGWKLEKWKARIYIDGKTYCKRCDYTDEGLKEAIEWYKQKSLELQGEYSIYNRPDENK